MPHLFYTFYKIKYVLFTCRSGVNISLNHIRVEIYKPFTGKLSNGICNKKREEYSGTRYLQKRGRKLQLKEFYLKATYRVLRIQFSLRTLTNNGHNYYL